MAEPRSGNSSARYNLPRHARHGGRRHAEPVEWAVSSAARSWQWVWSVDHDDQVAIAVARLLQFALLATMFFAMVAAAR